MSRRPAAPLTHDKGPLWLERRLSSGLQLEPKPEDVVEPNSPGEEETQGVPVLSTQSAAARKLGTQQIIPRNLAVASRTRARHHTTVVTLPVALETRLSEGPALTSQVSWEDYDSDGGGLSVRRNRRNKSYRAAVTSLDRSRAAPTLQPVSEERASGHQGGNQRSLGWKRNQRNRDSFKDEPRLYQEIRERGLHSNNQTADEELLENSGQDQSIVVRSYRPSQLTWSQLPQVKEMGILETISAEERKRQEAIFELITSEYSYQHSLDILVRQFQGSEELRSTMSSTEHHHLFSNISVIQAVSKGFFEDLERLHQDNPVIQDVSHIVLEHAADRFQPYINYCSNETFQQRTLQRLLTSSVAFKEVLKRIENSTACGGLPVISFLILPMQRVTRLPLLLDTICQKTPENTEEYRSAVTALKAISKLVKQCNDGARTMERTEQMYTIQKQLDFGKIKSFPLVSASRWLQKRGELTLCSEEFNIVRKAFSHRSHYLFLFNDVLIVTRKKSEESYMVVDYATLDNVEVELENSSLPAKQTGSTPYSLKLFLKKNREGRAEQIALAAESQIGRARWITALQKHKTTEPSKNKEALPQYEVSKAYIPKEPDELGLQTAEVVIVLQEEEDWYHGERMRDGERGWFPARCAVEITNRAALERNVRRMERLLETNV